MVPGERIELPTFGIQIRGLDIPLRSASVLHGKKCSNTQLFPLPTFLAVPVVVSQVLTGCLPEGGLIGEEADHEEGGRCP
jgi:hypothetical protein